MVIKKSCLFIGDSPHDQAVFVKALQDVSPETICFTANTAMDALYMVQDEGIVPDYIFIELYLPGMDAVEFLKRIKSDDDLKHIPVIVHCASPQPHKIIELKENGALAIYFRQYEYFGVCNMLNLYFSPSILTVQQN